MSEKKVIKLSDILNDLESGLTRTEIRKKYDLTQGDAKKLFEHESLKNRKPRKKSGFELIDDINKIQGEPEPTTDAADEETDNIEPTGTVEETTIPTTSTTVDAGNDDW